MRELFERLLADFVPDEVFDAHAHLYRKDLLGDDADAEILEGPDEIGWDAYEKAMRALWEDKAPKSGLFLPFPARKMDITASNRQTSRQVQHLLHFSVWTTASRPATKGRDSPGSVPSTRCRFAASTSQSARTASPANEAKLATTLVFPVPPFPLQTTSSFRS